MFLRAMNRVSFVNERYGQQPHIEDIKFGVVSEVLVLSVGKCVGKFAPYDWTEDSFLCRNIARCGLFILQVSFNHSWHTDLQILSNSSSMRAQAISRLTLKTLPLSECQVP